MSNTTPELLKLLLATIDNSEIFADPGFDEDLYRDKQIIEFKIECKAAFETLYKVAAECWNRTHYITLDGPDLSGIELCNKHRHFHTCWRESYQNAIRFVADIKDLPEKNDREFQYFMLGITEIIFSDYIHCYHKARHLVQA